MNARRLSGAVLVLSMLGLAGCASSAGTGNTPSASSTSSPAGTTSNSPTADPSVSAGSAALGAYLGFREALAAAQRSANPSEPSLDRYAADKALAESRASLLIQQQAGIVFRGKPVFSPRVLKVDLSGTGSVTISDCVDSSNWTPVYEATGKSAAAPGQPVRVPVSAVASTYDGRWVVRSMTSDRSRTC
jgi:hypothetical protein